MGFTQKLWFYPAIQKHVHDVSVYPTPIEIWFNLQHPPNGIDDMSNESQTMQYQKHLLTRVWDNNRDIEILACYELFFEKKTNSNC